MHWFRNKNVKLSRKPPFHCFIRLDQIKFSSGRVKVQASRRLQRSAYCRQTRRSSLIRQRAAGKRPVTGAAVRSPPPASFRCGAARAPREPRTGAAATRGCVTRTISDQRREDIPSPVPPPKRKHAHTHAQTVWRPGLLCLRGTMAADAKGR